jgi:hypothetical protein
VEIYRFKVFPILKDNKKSFQAPPPKYICMYICMLDIGKIYNVIASKQSHICGLPSTDNVDKNVHKISGIAGVVFSPRGNATLMAVKNICMYLHLIPCL